MEKGIAVVGQSTLNAEETEPPPNCRTATPLTEAEEASEPEPHPQLRLIRSERGASPASEFKRRFFPGVTRAQWNDWHWQLRNRVTGAEALGHFLRLSPAESAALGGEGKHLPLSITPYYLGLVDPLDPAQAIRRCVVPTTNEALRTKGEADDPLGEEHDTTTPGLVHRYPDRVLFLATGFCSVYCRYCTRSRLVGSHGAGCRHNRPNLERALAYIEAHPEVRDVLISGGDPLTLADERLEWLLSRLRRIPHVEILRIGTKAPVVLPQRITPALTKMLRRYHPLFMSIHFTHPDELTPEVATACGRLADAGIPLGSQTVLLKGINDQVATMTRLMQGLLKIRVRPYYLYQCDPISGSAHFRTPVNKGLEIIQGLRGHTTGYAVPTYVIDAPGGGGKVALYPEAVLGRRDDDLLLTNYQGGTYCYPDPTGA